jgi:hypothetical protein
VFVCELRIGGGPRTLAWNERYSYLLSWESPLPFGFGQLTLSKRKTLGSGALFPNFCKECVTAGSGYHFSSACAVPLFIFVTALRTPGKRTTGT